MRIQLDLDIEGVKILERLKELTGLKSHKDLFNNSITIFDWAVRQRLQGRIVASIDERAESYREFDMPTLSFAAARAKLATAHAEPAPAMAAAKPTAHTFKSGG
jgi:hypothetical protein